MDIIANKFQTKQTQYPINLYLNLFEQKKQKLNYKKREKLYVYL